MGHDLVTKATDSNLPTQPLAYRQLSTGSVEGDSRVRGIESVRQKLERTESTCQFRRRRTHRFEPWVGKIQRRRWEPASVVLPGKSQGQRSLAGYSPKGQTNEQLKHAKRVGTLLFF